MNTSSIMRCAASRVFGLALIWAAAGLCNTACAGRSGPYAAPSVEGRNTMRAEQLNRRAADLINSEPERALSLLREALTADLYFGPAHNNLGVLFLNRGELYEASSEFEWARKLMPGHPDPRINLALTLELAGRSQDAIAAYESALEVYPDHIASMQGLVRAQLRTGKTDARTAGFLKEVALRGEDRQWREWAQSEMLRRGPRLPRTAQ